MLYQLCNIDSSLVKVTPSRDHMFFLYCHIVSRKFQVLVTRKIQVSKLSIYREKDKNITPKMITFSVFYFIIKHLFLCVKQKSLRDVSFTHQTHVFIDSY